MLLAWRIRLISPRQHFQHSIAQPLKAAVAAVAAAAIIIANKRREMSLINHSGSLILHRGGKCRRYLCTYTAAAEYLL